MPAKKEPAPTPVENDDLLGSMGGSSDERPGEEEDLLAGLDGSGAPSWVPSPDEVPVGRQGTVVRYRDDMPDQFARKQNPGSTETVPVVTVRQANGESFRHICFARTLRNRVRELDLEPGDTYAAKYFGKKLKRDGNPKAEADHFHHWEVDSRKPSPTPPF